MNRKGILAGVALVVLLAGIFTYMRLTGGNDAEKASPISKEPAKEAKAGMGAGGAGAVRKEESKSVTMAPEIQRKNGVVIAVATKEKLGGIISATGKVEANADRIAHVSPRISGKIVSVRASLGDGVAAGQVLATLDSIELGEALGRFHQSRTKLALAQSNMERVKTLVEKKIAPRKEILQAETDFKTAQTELHTDAERLGMYGVSPSDLKGEDHRKPILPVRSPIGGTITEKHAIVGELSDPSRSLYTVADLSSVWVQVDIHEKDLAKVRKGQPATITVAAYPDLQLKGRITHIADLVDETTRTVKVRVEVANPGRKLKPEMFATVELTLPADGPPVLTIPEDAPQEMDGKKMLFVTENDTDFRPREIKVGRASRGMVEVTDGLGEAERYAVKGGFILKSELKKGELEGD